MANLLTDDVPTAAFRRALQARDADAVLALCSDDVALHSPVTQRTLFEGTSDVRIPLLALFATVDDIAYLADVGEGTTRVLFATGNINGEPIEWAIRVGLDDQQKVRELTLFVRPLAGLAALGLGVGPRIVRGFGGRVASWLARAQLAPIALETRLFDRLVGIVDRRVRSQRRRRARR